MNLSLACQTLGVSRSGYHAHLHKHRRPRRLQDSQLAAEIRTAFTASRRTYGSPRLMHCLRRKGLKHGKTASPGSCASSTSACFKNAASSRAPLYRQGLASGSQPPAQTPRTHAPR